MHARRAVALAVPAALLLSACVVHTRPVLLPLERRPMEQARQQLARPLLENLRDFGNNLARVMLADYRFRSVTPTRDGNALLYRYDAASPGVPRHAYLVVVRFPEHARGTKLVTGVGEGTYKIGLTGASVALVAADEPAVLEGNGFRLRMARGYMEAFNPWCAVELPSCIQALNLFMKDPVTKAEKQKELAGLLLAAMPRLEYADREP